MKIYGPLTASILFVMMGACSDQAQFNESAGAKLIDAETIVYSGQPTVEDPSADAAPPLEQIDPATGLPIGGGAVVTGTSPGAGTGTPGGASTPVAGAPSGTPGVTTPGASMPGTPASQEIADNVEKLKAVCSTGVKKTLKQSIRFAETQKCNWGVNGNLARRDAYLQAIVGQKASITLPANAQLCDLGIGSAATTIQYDDFMILTMNNQVLLSSNKELMVGLTEDQDKAYVWDFSKARGKAVNFDAPSYCLGNSSLCEIPVTDVQGSFKFSIDPSVLGKLAANSTNKAKLDFALYATGDNDDRDCWHTAFTLDFTLNYVE